MRDRLKQIGETITKRQLLSVLPAIAFAALFSLAATATADELLAGPPADAFSRRAYDQEMSEMRFGFAKRRNVPVASQTEAANRARRISALLPNAGVSFRAHHAFSAEAAAEQLEAAERKATDRLSMLERRAKAAITARPTHQRLVRKSSWLGSLGLDRRTVDQRQLESKVGELRVGTARQVDEVEQYLGDIEADGFLYTVARASHRLVIAAEKSAMQIYNDYVAPASAYADEGDSNLGYPFNGSRPPLSFERDGISRF